MVAAVFRKISPRKISDEIIEQFKVMVSNGELKPGDELPSERELAELIGVSRPPLREALNALQAMGYVEIRPRSRILVRSLAEKPLQDPISALIKDDIGKLFELLEVRRAMESWAAYKAAERATPEDLERLADSILRDQENFRRGREDARTDADIHVGIAMATHNTIFSHLTASCYHLLWDAQKISREKIFQRKENRQLIAGQHLGLFEAIRERNPKRASQTAREHIDFVERELRKMIGEKSASGIGRQA